MNHRTETTIITIETFQRTTVHLRRKAKIAWCDRCKAKTVMLAPNEAAAHLQITTREIFRLTEAGDVHCSKTETGELLVCRNSLAALTKHNKPTFRARRD